MEHRKGCPACEHTNPQLEQELDALAQLLFDAYIEDCGVPAYRFDAVDNAEDLGRLKEVDSNHN